MAKIQGPLLSADAHGSLSKILTYSHRQSGTQVRKFNKPLELPSESQAGQRRLATFIIAQWQAMSAATKATWENKARTSGINLPGYQYFLRTALQNPYIHHGLAGYWSFNKIVGGKVLDISKLDNHGTLGPSFPANAPKLTASKERKFSNALDFDGYNDYIDCGDKPAYDFSTALSFSVLIKPDALGTNQCVLAKYSTAAKREWNLLIWLMYTGRATPRVYFGNPANGNFIGYIRTLAHPISVNEWYLITFTYNAGTCRLWLNSVEQSIYVGTGTIPSSLFNGTYPIKIGYAGQSGNRFNGIIDEVSIYNRVLSPAEITARWTFARF